jgi:hypothetical protein
MHNLNRGDDVRDPQWCRHIRSRRLHSERDHQRRKHGVQAAIDELDADKSATSHAHANMVTTDTDQTINGAKMFTRQYGSQIAAVAGATSTTVNWNDGNVQKITMTGNITTLTLSNPVAGARYVLIIRQDVTGSRTIAWPGSVLWASATAPTLSGSNKTDIVSFVYDGINYFGGYGTNY